MAGFNFNLSFVIEMEDNSKESYGKADINILSF